MAAIDSCEKDQETTVINNNEVPTKTLLAVEETPNSAVLYSSDEVARRAIKSSPKIHYQYTKRYPGQQVVMPSGSMYIVSNSGSFIRAVKKGKSKKERAKEKRLAKREM